MGTVNFRTSARKQFTLFSIMKVSSFYIASHEALQKLEKSMLKPYVQISKASCPNFSELSIRRRPKLSKGIRFLHHENVKLYTSQIVQDYIRMLCHQPPSPDLAGTDLLEYKPQFSSLINTFKIRMWLISSL
jgi:hypothetical protein